MKVLERPFAGSESDPVGREKLSADAAELLR